VFFFPPPPPPPPLPGTYRKGGGIGGGLGSWGEGGQTKTSCYVHCIVRAGGWEERAVWCTQGDARKRRPKQRSSWEKPYNETNFSIFWSKSSFHRGLYYFMICDTSLGKHYHTVGRPLHFATLHSLRKRTPGCQAENRTLDLLCSRQAH